MQRSIPTLPERAPVRTVDAQEVGVDVCVREPPPFPLCVVQVVWLCWPVLQKQQRAEGRELGREEPSVNYLLIHFGR